MSWKFIPQLVSGLAIAIAAGSASAQTVFKPSRLFVVAATDGSEQILELSASTVDAGAATAIENQFSDGTVLQQPWGAAFGPDGNLYVATVNPNNATDASVVRYGPTGAQVGTPITNANLMNPKGVCFGPNGHLFVASSGNGVVMEFDIAGNFIQNVGIATNLTTPTGVTFGCNGHLFVTDSGRDSVFEFVPLAFAPPVREMTVGGALDSPQGILFGPRGHLFVVSRNNNKVIEIDGGGSIGVTVPSTSTMVNPSNIAIGPDGNFYITSEGSNRIVVLDGDETPTGLPNEQIAAIGNDITISGPTGLAFAPFRIGVQLKGSSFNASMAKTNETEKFGGGKGPIVQFVPGSRTYMLSVFDDPADASDLAGLMSGTFFVFQGFQTTQDITNSKRAFAGNDFPTPDFDFGSTMLQLSITGNVDNKGFYTPTDLSGKMIHEARNAIVSTSVSFIKVIK